MEFGLFLEGDGPLYYLLHAELKANFIFRNLGDFIPAVKRAERNTGAGS
jgi:hypothetical protein